MKRFECTNCSNTVHFDNVVCVSCNNQLGFDPHSLTMLSFSGAPEGFIQCANAAEGGCNWLIGANENETYCFSCRLDQMVPDLSNPDHVAQWSKLEAAKRHFLFGLMRLKLPIVTRLQNPDEGLAFELLADDATPDGSPVMTGHDSGLITINVAEANDPEREARRVALGEPLRTLIGHFRHESGHYYWNLLVRDANRLDEARAVFGDETQDYGEALKRHYDEGAPANWQDNFISSYASSHPWEDFAETWAHYLHLVDGLETAYTYQLMPKDSNGSFEPAGDWSVQKMTEAWVRLTIGVNAVNRSIGQPDFYSFIFSPAVMAKLGYVHSLIGTSALQGVESTPVTSSAQAPGPVEGQASDMPQVPNSAIAAQTQLLGGAVFA